MFPSSAYMVMLHADFMIDVLGVSQSGASRIEVRQQRVMCAVKKRKHMHGQGPCKGLAGRPTD